MSIRIYNIILLGYVRKITDKLTREGMLLKKYYQQFLFGMILWQMCD